MLRRKNKKYYKDLLFDNFPGLTCHGNVSLINSLIFSFETRWLNIQDKEENNDQKSGKNRCPYPAFFSLSLIARHFLSTYYIHYKCYIFVKEIFTRTCFFDFVANSRKFLFGKIKSRQEPCQNKVK